MEGVENNFEIYDWTDIFRFRVIETPGAAVLFQKVTQTYSEKRNPSAPIRSRTCASFHFFQTKDTY